MTQVLKQAEELPPGWMGHCTVLDNTFGFDGVRIKGTKATYMPYHMHVASLSLYSEPISSTVQAIVAEFGPNTPPGMVMPPVPCVVQNRDSVVTDGHHSGHSSGSSGRGGSGGGIAVGRGHKSGRSIGLATSIGVLPPAGHGRESLRVNIDGGGELHLQKAVGKCVLGWSFADAVSLGNDTVPSSTPSSSSGSLASKAGSHGSGAVGPGRLVCPPSRYNSSIGKADDVPKGEYDSFSVKVHSETTSQFVFYSQSLLILLLLFWDPLAAFPILQLALFSRVHRLRPMSDRHMACWATGEESLVLALCLQRQVSMWTSRALVIEDTMVAAC